MGDVDPCVVRKPLTGLPDVGGEKLAAAWPECGDHICDGVAAFRAADLNEIAIFGWPSNRVRDRRSERHRPKDTFSRGPHRRIEPPKHLFGMIIELLFQSAVVCKLQRDLLAGSVFLA